MPRPRKPETYAKPLGMKAVVGVRQGGARSVRMIGADEIDDISGSFDAGLREKAKNGHEDSLAYIRDCLRVRTLMLDGRKLIDHGVLVGARHG